MADPKERCDEVTEGSRHDAGPETREAGDWVRPLPREATGARPRRAEGPLGCEPEENGVVERCGCEPSPAKSGVVMRCASCENAAVAASRARISSCWLIDVGVVERWAAGVGVAERLRLVDLPRPRVATGARPSWLEGLAAPER